MRTHACTRKWNHTCKENGNVVTTQERCGSYVEREQSRNPVGVVCRGQEELMGQNGGCMISDVDGKQIKVWRGTCE